MNAETPSQEESTAAEPPRASPWDGLPPERFELLRLAPLPTDRDSGARPLRFAQLGRLERHAKEQSLLRLTVQLPGQLARAHVNELEVWVDHKRQELRFGDHPLLTEPGNRGLGRFLLAQGIAWARQRWSHYQVEDGILSLKDAPSDALRERRDHALRAQGLKIDYLDGPQIKARYSAARVSELHADWNLDKVQRLGVLDTAAMLEQADRTLGEQDVALRKLQERVGLLQREDGGLRFTIVCLVAFAVFQAGLLIWIASH